MKKVIFLAFLILGIFTACNSPKKDINEKAVKAELDGYANEYMKNLKTVLVSNMKAGGPMQAVNICSDTAADMTKNYSELKNVEVKRFSFKNRNPQNTPDNFETKALKKFEILSEEGKLNQETFVLETANVDGREVVKFAKPILVGAPCLNCHGGEEVSEEVAQIINENYPDDKARGYKIGDLRGGISISKEL